MRRYLFIGLLIFVLADLSYSFLQHLHQPLDGDMAWNLLPADEVQQTLDNPFGRAALLHGDTYANPNRFFCHWIFREYLLKTPLALQSFTTPIDSVYLACAIAKTLIQLALLLLLTMAITGSTRIFTQKTLVSLALLTPFFQTNGYQGHLGIIDPSTTYAFFYALPAAFLLLYFLPLIQEQYHGKPLKYKGGVFLLSLPLAVVVCLSGPLNPGAVLVTGLLFFVAALKNRFRHIPQSVWLFMLPVGFLSLYSLYLGRYNSITLDTQIPLAAMYARLPEGIYRQFTGKLGYPLLLGTLLVNAVFIYKKYKNEEGTKILAMYKWGLLFALLYILLLPLGGYRAYRPFIVRYDTILPVTLIFLLLYGVSTLFLLKKITKKQRYSYLPFLIGVLSILTLADEPEFSNNDCEYAAIQQIVASQHSPVPLPYDCKVINWVRIEDPALSAMNAELLYKWRITKGVYLFYNKK